MLGSWGRSRFAACTAAGGAGEREGRVGERERRERRERREDSGVRGERGAREKERERERESACLEAEGASEAGSGLFFCTSRHAAFTRTCLGFGVNVCASALFQGIYPKTRI